MTWTWLLSRSSFFIYIFFCCFLVFPCHSFQCGVHNQSSSASAPALVRCGQTEQCAALHHTQPIPSSNLANDICNRMEPLRMGFLLFSFAFFSTPRKGRKSFPVRDSVENDFSWMECHTLYDNYHGSRKKTELHSIGDSKNFIIYAVCLLLNVWNFWRADSHSRFHKYWAAVSAVRQLTFA